MSKDMHRFKSTFNDDDFLSLRRAAARGKLNAMERYERDTVTGEITIWTRTPPALFSQLEAAIDFGAISAKEAFH